MRHAFLSSMILVPALVFAGDKPKDLFKAELVKLYGADEKGKLPKANAGYCSTSPAVAVVIKQASAQAEHPRQYNTPVNVFADGTLIPGSLQMASVGSGAFDAFPLYNIPVDTALCVASIKVNDKAVYVEAFTKAPVSLNVAGTTQSSVYKVMFKFPVTGIETLKAEEFKKNVLDALLQPASQQQVAAR